jgi:hypothetical protein
MYHSSFYIKHKLIKRNSFNKWMIEYEPQIINLFSIFVEILNSRHENSCDINDYELFLNFCKFIYNKSSSYIMKI